MEVGGEVEFYVNSGGLEPFLKLFRGLTLPLWSSAGVEPPTPYRPHWLVEGTIL